MIVNTPLNSFSLSLALFLFCWFFFIPLSFARLSIFYIPHRNTPSPAMKNIYTYICTNTLFQFSAKPFPTIWLNFGSYHQEWNLFYIFIWCIAGCSPRGVRGWPGFHESSLSDPCSVSRSSVRMMRWCQLLGISLRSNGWLIRDWLYATRRWV